MDIYLSHTINNSLYMLKEIIEVFISNNILQLARGFRADV